MRVNYRDRLAHMSECFTSSSRRALSHSFWPGACCVHSVISWLMLSVTALERRRSTGRSLIRELKQRNKTLFFIDSFNTEETLMPKVMKIMKRD